MAAEGWAVVIHYNDSAADAASLVEEIKAGGGRAASLMSDLSEPNAPGDLIANASRPFGVLTCLVNNASRFEPDEVGSITPGSFAAHLDTNLRAPVLLSQAFAGGLASLATGSLALMIRLRIWTVD